MVWLIYMMKCYIVLPPNLLRTNFKTKFVFQDGLTPLLQAIRMKNKDLVLPLIENGADVDTPFKDVRKNPMNFVSVFMISNLYSCL